jgi:hypothetical protein
MEFENLQASNDVSKFQKSFATCKWGVMCMIYKTKF